MKENRVIPNGVRTIDCSYFAVLACIIHHFLTSVEPVIPLSLLRNCTA